MSDPSEVRQSPVSTTQCSARRVAVIASALAYFLIVAGLAVYAFLRPTNYWDMLAYIGVVESWHTSDATSIHSVVYSTIRNVPEYDVLVGNEPPSDYNRDVAQDSFDFGQQLPIYSIKFLYCLTLAALHRAGLSYLRALDLISIVSFIGVAVILWLWFRRYLNAWWCAMFAALLLVSPPLYAMGRFATPDALELWFVAMGLYLLLETSRSAAGSLLLLLAIWVRPDGLILVGLLFCVFLFLKAIDLVEWGTFCFLALLTYGVIRIFGGPYSWGIFVHHSFIGPLKEPGNAIVAVPLRLYVFTAAQNAWTFLKSSSVALSTLMGVLAIALHKRRSYRYVTAIVLVSEFVHFLLFPSSSHRFYMVSALFAPVSLVLACSDFLPDRPALVDSRLPLQAAAD